MQRPPWGHFWQTSFWLRVKKSTRHCSQESLSQKWEIQKQNLWTWFYRSIVQSRMPWISLKSGNNNYLLNARSIHFLLGWCILLHFLGILFQLLRDILWKNFRRCVKMKMRTLLKENSFKAIRKTLTIFNIGKRYPVDFRKIIFVIKKVWAFELQWREAVYE